MTLRFYMKELGGAGLCARQREAARDGRPTNTSYFSSFVVSVKK
jgi:hypothetical protein